jgi:hypothetical protein
MYPRSARFGDRLLLKMISTGMLWYVVLLVEDAKYRVSFYCDSMETARTKALAEWAVKIEWRVN